MIWQLHGALGRPADFEGLDLGGFRGVDLYDQVAPYAEWARAFCARVRQEDDAPVLMGYSMGGRLALHALLEDPALWRGAVIVSAHYGHGRDPERIERDSAWARMARDLPWSKFMEKWNHQPVFAETADAGDRAYLRTRRDAVSAGFDYWSVGRQENLLARLATLDFPVLWVVGERDQKFVDLGREAVEKLPSGRLEILPDAGHRVPWDQPENFAARVRTFVSEILG